MKLGKISIAFTAEKADFTKNLRFIPFLRKAAVWILYIMSSEDYTIGNLKKVRIVPTVRTGNEPCAFPWGWRFFNVLDRIHLFHASVNGYQFAVALIYGSKNKMSIMNKLPGYSFSNLP